MCQHPPDTAAHGGIYYIEQYLHWYLISGGALLEGCTGN